MVIHGYTKKGNSFSNLLDFQINESTMVLSIGVPNTLSYDERQVLMHQGFPFVGHSAAENDTLRVNIPTYIAKSTRQYSSKALERALLALETHRDNLLKTMLELIQIHNTVAFPPAKLSLETERQLAYQRGVDAAERQAEREKEYAVREAKECAERESHLAVLYSLLTTAPTALTALAEGRGVPTRSMPLETQLRCVFLLSYPEETVFVDEWLCQQKAG